jgi:large subunit ribosomal protein L21
MYAVIETGGKQYRVAVGDHVCVESLPAETGATVTLDKVLMISGKEGTQVGGPQLPGGVVEAKVIGHGRGDKIRVFKLRRRKHYRKTIGHRQNYTELQITAIAGGA